MQYVYCSNLLQLIKCSLKFEKNNYEKKNKNKLVNQLILKIS